MDQHSFVYRGQFRAVIFSDRCQDTGHVKKDQSGKSDLGSKLDLGHSSLNTAFSMNGDHGQFLFTHAH